jgi:hypothetical protein
VSLLSIVQSVSLRVLSQKPTVAAASADPKILQIVELVNNDGQELNARHTWQVNRVESSFLTLAAEPQGSITTLAGPDFQVFVNESMWNRSTRRPIFGPRTPAEWQQLKAQFTIGPWTQYTIRGNQLLFTPIPPAGQSVFFEWCSSNWCTSALGVGQTAMALDTDVSDFGDRLHILGALWRFKKENHLEYEEDFNAYEAAVNDAIIRDGSRGRLSLRGSMTDQYPGVIVPAGSWQV